MKVLLLNPPFLDRFSRTSRSPAVTKGGTIYYPLWLAYATGVLEQAGHDVKLIDAPVDCITNEEIVSRLGGFEPDLIVMDTSTPSIYSDAECAQFFKKKFPRSFVVLVGTHPSAMPEWTLNLSPSIDAVTRGEYDYTLRDLALALQEGHDLSGVLGISYMKGSAVYHCPERPLIMDLDELPFVTSVYKKHLDIRSYFFAAACQPMVMIITGRGCPQRCFFCVYPQTFHSRAYRPRSPRNVVDEFIYIKENLPGVREIGIEDDTFTVNNKRCAEICDILIEEKLNMRWYCNARADLPHDLLVKMRKAGCRLVTVGFESGSQEILDAMHKGLRLETMRRFVRDAKKAGILIHGCIMAGNPGDTEKTLRDSFEFALELDCDSMQFFPLFVYPGTEAYSWAEERGYLTTTDFRQWLDGKGDYRCVIDLPGLSGERIAELCKSYYAKYHLRPSYILRKALQGIRRPGEGLRTARSALTFFRFMLRKKFSGIRTSARSGDTGPHEHDWEKYWGDERQLEKFSRVHIFYEGVVQALLDLSTPQSRCLEVGCGSGTYAVEFASRGRNCIGFDSSPSALRIARKKGKYLYDLDIELLAGDLYRFPFKEDSFDLIFSDGVIEHLDIPRTLVEMKRILKPGGCMVAKVPARSLISALVYYGLAPFRNRAYEAWLSRKDWLDLLRESGYANAHIKKCGSIIDAIMIRLLGTTKLPFSVKIGRIYNLMRGYKP